MKKENEDIFKELQKNQKYLIGMENDLLKEINFIKNFLKHMDRKVSRILEKIEELEVVMEVSEIMEEDEEDQEYDTEWSPYDDDSYEQYGDDHEEPQ
jgi:hypothetical protein